MNEVLAAIVLPIVILLAGIYLAIHTRDATWLILAAILAITTGLMIRRTIGS